MGFIAFLLSPLFYMLAFTTDTSSEKKITSNCDINEVISSKRNIIIKQLVFLLISLAGVLSIILDCVFYEYEYETVSALYGVKYLGWGDGELSLVVSILEIIVIGITLFVYLLKLSSVKQECLDKKQEIDEKEKNQKEKQAKKEKHYDKVLRELKELYGKEDRVLCIDELIPETSVIAFSSSKTLYVQGQILTFGEIIGYSLLDDSQQITTTSGTNISKTNANASSVVGRALVGGLIGGSTGAIIGGATASSTTTSQLNSTSRTKICHDYSVKIQIADITNPTLTVECGSNETFAYDLIALINAIMALNVEK